jgi:large subunit ribosomal protein L25
MRSIDLNVVKRSSSESPKGLRREGTVPAVLYGAGGDNVELKLNLHEFQLSGINHHSAQLIKLQSSDTDVSGSIALLKEMQSHPVSKTPVHIDFLRLNMKQPVDAIVALNYVGKPVGTVDGGVLQPIRRDLMVRALPGALPEHIDVDVTELAIHDSIHVEDLTLGEGIEAIFTENFTLVTVGAPTVVEEPSAEEGAVEAAPAAEEAAAEGSDD